MKMAPSFKLTFSFFMIILCSRSTLVSYGKSDLFQPEYLKVPVSEFLSLLKSTINAIRNVTSTLSHFSNVSNDFRLSNAISDCLDLLDLSAELLNWTLSSVSHTHGGFHYGTGKRGSDFATWLNGVLVNQDTCLEGFDGTVGKERSLVEASQNQIIQFVNSLLDVVRRTPDSKPKGGGTKRITREETFPSWLKSKDRKLIQTLTPGSADVVVAADGTGNFTSIKDAIKLAPNRCYKWFVIYIKKGVYDEYVDISKKEWNIVLMGDGMDATVITGNRNYADGWPAHKSATVSVHGPGFMARDITFENTAGPEKHQAVAFLSEADLSTLYRCAFRGYQDTLYVHIMRQFYKDCVITGTVDFIFGRGTAVFQNCQIFARKGLPNQKNTITAHGRRIPNDDSGFSIQFSNISAEPDVLASQGKIQTYLGRPWKLYSRTVIMQSNISAAIHPRGWLEWNGNFALDSLYFGEYMNYGPGASLDNRVKWPGFHDITDPSEASKFTVAQLILGEFWLPATGIKYKARLDPN